MAAFRPAVSVAAKFTQSPITSFQTATSPVLLQADATRTSLFINSSMPAGSSAISAGNELPMLDVNFCGECLPLDQSAVADRWKHVFTLFRNNTSDLGSLQKRADAFFPIIDPILEQYDIPQDFRYVPLAESGLKAKAVSPMGAAGYWQLMPGTARELGLKVGKGVDERFNVHKATVAACKYLRKLYDQLGSWSLVAAAYNAGPGYLKNQLRRDAHRDYYRMNLPRETRYYLFRVLVYKEVLSRPDDYLSFLS
ncbi:MULTISPECIES: lytic transglycosylase domain-containing protein [Spirosoma]|uniref:Lytic transglycosylase domain-containing protein n=1 Tax=Spirosoma sordidisoli TaxID=2502893 RepID=A0A4Q2UM83_9BACT|nr:MULTISPECIES: lytic transglycosylase domain-containing protein [Spirosoma]RYC70474.1 lytic transglycosylase domain-containing protein [Spirosoma sordidisoli]